jgi:uncharacterized protein
VARRLHRKFVVRLSAFNIYIPDYPEAGTTLVYNTFSGGFVSLDEATLAILRKADGGAALEPSEQELLDPDFFDDAVGILVESRSAEEKVWRAHHESWRSSTSLDVIVSTTFACNFACSYCFQDDVLNGKVMSVENADRTAEWLADRALAIGAKEIDLKFIGGEPLLQPERIERIVAGVASRLAGAGIKLTFYLITNGYFLTRELVEKWRPLGLRGAKVTLDGDETTHPITRRSKKKDENSFQRIFDNAIAVSDLIEIYLTGNYQLETVHGFIPLIKKLKAGGLKSGSKMKFSPALQALGVPTDAALSACNWGGSNPEYMVAFTDEARLAGFSPTDLTSIGPCAFHRRHSYSIDPDGFLYKCVGFLGKTEWAIGHVTTGLSERYDRLANANPQRLCGDCAHRPSCSGGCIATAWIEAGRAEGVNCEIEYFQSKALEDQLKRKHALATHDTVEEALALFPRRTVEPRTDVVQRRGPSLSLRVLAA